MEIIHEEKVKLTTEERELLDNARDLLTKIYEEAADREICDLADTAYDAIDDLSNYYV